MAVKRAICASDNINWLCPINWDVSLNDDLLALYQVFQNQPGWQSSQLLNLVDPLYGAHGTLNGPTWQGTGGLAGSFGSLLHDGTDDYTDCGNIPLDNDNWTLSCWVYMLRVTGFNRILSWHGSGPTIWQGAVGTYGFGIVHSGNVDLSNTSLVIDANRWQHLAITRSGSEARVYVDREVVASSSSFAVTFTADSSLRIGNSTAFSEPTNAYYDKVRAYRRGLSASEISALIDDDLAGNPLIINRVRPYTVFDMGVAPPGNVSQFRYLPLLGAA